MPSIKITDALSGDLIVANPQAHSGFAKYLKGPAAQLVAGADFAAQLQRDLPLVSPGDSGFKLHWAQGVPFGNDGVTASVSAGAASLLSVYNRSNMLLLDDAFVGPPLKVAPGEAFVAFLLRPTIDVSGAQTSGALTFGLEASSEAEWRFYRRFDMNRPATLGAACRQLFEGLILPSTVSDVREMAEADPGTMAVVSGRGQLTIGCSANVLAAVNPLASVDTLGKVGKLEVSVAAVAKVGVNATLSGDFQIRVQTIAPGRVRLGYHKMAAQEVGVTLDAAAGPGLTLGDRDLLKMLFGAPQSPGGSIEEELVAGGVTTAQLEKIIAALRTGLSRKLQLEVSAAFSSLRQHDAAFLYEIDVAALDDAGAQAVDQALSGDLSALTLLEEDPAPHGITLLQSRTEVLRRRQIKWRLNIVGLLNVLSVSELAVKGTVVHDEESGEVVMTDAVTSSRVKAGISRKELQRLLYESLMLTVTYKAAGVAASDSLAAAQSYFKLDRDVNRQEMSDYLDAVAAVGLMPAADIEERLGRIDDFDRSSLLIEVEYDQAACERMFLGDDGRPRERDFYEDIGKLALLALVQDDDPDAYRRIPLRDGVLWQRMRDNVSNDFRTILPPPITAGTEDEQKLHVAVVTADYLTIVWWAGAMARAAERLAAMRAFLAGPPPVVPSDRNKAFLKRRDELTKAMTDVVRKSPSTFGGDPWGLVALFYASRRSAEVSCAVISPRLTLFLP